MQRRHGKSNVDGIKRGLYELARKGDLEKSWPRCSFSEPKRPKPPGGEPGMG